MARVFLSYVHKEPDESLARELAESLSKFHEVFIDTMITAGKVWGDVIDEQLQTADFLVALISANSAASPMVIAEIASAHQFNVTSSRPAILPVRLDSSKLKYPLRAYVSRFQEMTWNEPADTPQLAKQVLRALDQKAASPFHSPEREQMIRRVRADWIEGILDKSLYRAARIELGLKPEPKAIEHRVDAVVQRPDEDPIPLREGTRLISVFDDHLGQLLILGAPGSGKTTLLLELASELLDRAESDSQHPIPVIFNLSSWAMSRAPLEDWLIEELRLRSDVPRQIAQRWVKEDQLLLLLDGLDEVAADHRDACVDTINAYRTEHGFVKIAVCSRVIEYQALTRTLRLPAAILILPLARSQVLEYLEEAGPALESIRSAVDRDPGLWGLLETPLTLSIVAIAGKNLPAGNLETDSVSVPEKQREQLFAYYVDAMFKRRTKETRYSREQMRRWLTWLATALVRREQTQFRIEDLRHSWLQTRVERFGVIAFVVLAVAMASAVLGSFLFAELDSGSGPLLVPMLHYFRYFIGVGLLVTMARGRSNGPIDLVEVRWPGFLSLSKSMCEGGLFGAVLGFMCGYIECGVDMGWQFALIVGVTFALGAAMNALARARELEIRPTPNFALSQSLRNTLAYTAVSLIVAVLAYVLAKTLPSHIESLSLPKTGDRVNVAAGLVSLTLLGWVGFFFGMEKGGYFLLDHYATRFLLWRRRSIPWNYVRFLDAAVARVFLRRIGAGYIFVHRMLLDYFASGHRITSEAGDRKP